jgi:hypothetical protein
VCHLFVAQEVPHERRQRRPTASQPYRNPSELTERLFSNNLARDFIGASVTMRCVASLCLEPTAPDGHARATQTKLISSQQLYSEQAERADCHRPPWVAPDKHHGTVNGPRRQFGNIHLTEAIASVLNRR